MQVEYVSHYGDDLAVVNAARVSLGKASFSLDNADKKLIKYLAKHKHFSPFRHCHITVRVECPITVERQWTKHRLGVEINSISGRYVTYEESFYKPSIFRKGSVSIKQGSLPEAVDEEWRAHDIYMEGVNNAFIAYHKLLNMGVCKEQARMVLPQACNTQFVCTFSLQAAAHFYKLRSAPDAQAEIREYAEELDRIISPLFPEAWAALKEHM
jgi:thymidylate synthase (FAD)